MTLDAEVPALIPVRMVNEFVYCPRLCYMEWVQRRWDSNDDTAQGAFRHRSVDAKGGVLPSLTDGSSATPRSTYSVALSDEEWGLTGVIDRIDHFDDQSTPVDLKKGHPRNDGTPWPADRIQALCQAALVESAGFHVSEAPPRRILPRSPDSAPMYVVEQGARVGVHGGRLQVTLKGEVLAEARLIDVLHLCVLGHVQVSTEALTRLWATGASVLWLSTGGWLNGWSQGHPSKYVDLRRQQVAYAAHGGNVPASIVHGKIRNQRTLLMRNAKRAVDPAVISALKQLAHSALECRASAALLGYEGTAARLYFDNFGAMLSDPTRADSFESVGRSRRPPGDPVNAVLGFCYSLLTKDLVATCLGVGLDPYLGVLHRPRYGRPALALDLAEEFRPLVADSVTLQVFNNGEVTDQSFVRRNAGVQLTTDGRRSVLRAYERRMSQEIKHPYFGYKITYRHCLDVQARLMAAVLMGEIPSYPPLVTR